jgi:hypothetical protein
MVLYLRFLVAILVVVALLYELCKVCLIHYTVTINTHPFHFLLISDEDILQTYII